MGASGRVVFQHLNGDLSFFFSQEKVVANIGPSSDGIFLYTGEGQIGDMEFVRGNLAVRDHKCTGRDLLLFERLGKSGSYRFNGYFTCDGFEYGASPDKTGASRRIIIFHLRPASDPAVS
jgi:hypothetical protein